MSSESVRDVWSAHSMDIATILCILAGCLAMLM